ncbi:MAG: alpha/beta hydrolase, partial [Planctomycetia bacterium]|nr:alpha/beta hydrolase [Planctomycetia bacterium]
APVETHRNIPYAETDNPRQQLDLYLPQQRGEKLLPVVAFIHGGGWQTGGKGNGQQVIPYVATGNYAGVSIGYRLTDEASWPAQIHDCKSAIRWIRANAEKYGLDPDRIGVFGTSAGGHLVAMLGTTGDNKALEGDLGKYQNVSSRVTCVVDFFGPTELLTMGTWHDNPGSPESKLVGGTLQETKDVARQASPITHASKDAVPFLIIHGTKDAVVPFDQSVKFHAALKAVGVDSTLLEMSDAGHGEPFHSGKFGSQMQAFFDKHLRGVE